MIELVYANRDDHALLGLRLVIVLESYLIEYVLVERGKSPHGVEVEQIDSYHFRI